MMPKERYAKLQEYLSEENPVFLEVIEKYQALDNIAYDLGLLAPEETYTAKISWWPMISILGTFSAGKSTFVNGYVGACIQQTGNQAIDDKFTVMCYGHNGEPVTLPGLSLDADPRFPFYNISEEVNKVDPGEGSRVNLYLQLKTLNSEKLKGKILIDSPGFDADAQRDAILRMTSHIVEMSDLVLIFFDARHPEPGAMRDTLKHLVATTIAHKDANKVLYILNQIDTTAKEDNLEDVIGSWQRALAQEGLVSGNFFGIYNEDAAANVGDEALLKRLKGKRDSDYTRILERMDHVGIERAYRIIKTLIDTAQEMKEQKIPLLHERLRHLRRNVWRSNAVAVILVLMIAGLLQWQFHLFASMESLVWGGSIVVAIIAVVHVKSTQFFTAKEVKKWQEKQPDIARAIAHNASWWRLLFGFTTQWKHGATKRLDALVTQGREAIQKLNDQFVAPAGTQKVNTAL